MHARFFPRCSRDAADDREPVYPGSRSRISPQLEMLHHLIQIS